MPLTTVSIHNSNFSFAARGQLEDLGQPFVGRMIRSGPACKGAHNGPQITYLVGKRLAVPISKNSTHRIWLLHPHFFLAPHVLFL